MKQIIIFSIILMQTAMAQEAMQYIYQGRFNSGFGRREQFRDYRGILTVDGPRSLFTMKEEGVTLPSLQDLTVDLRPDSIFTVYKDQDSNSLLFEFADLSQRSHWYADTLFPMDWTLLEEEKQIGGIPCRKAITFFKGRRYVAWYAPSITQGDGPWKLGGLPGLILEAHDEAEEWHMTMLSMQTVKPFANKPFEDKMRKGMQGFADYASYLKTLEKRLQASLGNSGGEPCSSCPATPTVKIHSWESIEQ
jgi:hypothetical protein